MNKWLKTVLVVALAAAMAALLGACAGAEQKPATNDQAKTPVSNEVKAETGEYTGTLVVAYENKMSLSGKDGDVEFATDKNTVYDLGDIDAMYLDDTVSVSYHVDNNVKVVDKVSIVEHKDTAIEFAGTLVDSDDDSLTLASKGVTATFQMDSDTYLVGNLSRGDAVELTYLGNLSEYPYANVVAVVTEAEQPKTVTTYGVVSELADNSLLLAIDSAHAYRYAITSNTKITGVANEVNEGDQVEITYSGNTKETPEALEINVVKQSEKRAYTINGRIIDVKQDVVAIDTDKATYAFSTNDKTRYRGDKPAGGLKAEITYTGTLGDNPVAAVVYCVKDVKATSKAVAEKQKAQSGGTTSSKTSSKTSGKASSKTSNAAESKSNTNKQSADNNAQKSDATEKAEKKNSDASKQSTGSDTDDANQDAEDTDESTTDSDGDTDGAEEPEVKVSGQGTIVKGDESKQTVEIKMKDGTTITLSYDDDTKIAGGYIPAKGDTVQVVYGSSSMKLSSIQLVNRATDADDEADADESDADESDADKEE